MADKVLTSKQNATMFSGTIMPKDNTKYNGHRGITDWGNMEQFDLFQTGYAFLVVVNMPPVINALAKKNAEIASLMKQYKHILQHEFRGLEGIDDITAEATEITDGITSVEITTKVTQQSNATITLSGYRERSGSILTKMHELMLKCSKDSRSGYRHYFGLIEDGTLEKSFQNEIMTLMYIVTDDTGLRIEKAYGLLACQPTKAETSMYNVTRGEIGWHELSCEFRCVPVTGADITAKAEKMLNNIKIVRREDNWVYTSNASESSPTGVATDTGAWQAVQPSV